MSSSRDRTWSSVSQNIKLQLTWYTWWFPRIASEEKLRSMLLAPTVTIQGAVLLTVPGAGPAFPAEQKVVIPFWKACKAPMAIASSKSGGRGGSEPSDNVKMSTPSPIASSIAARMSVSTHPPVPPRSGQQTLYAAILACGAPPFAVPFACPYKFTSVILATQKTNQTDVDHD